MFYADKEIDRVERNIAQTVNGFEVVQIFFKDGMSLKTTADSFESFATEEKGSQTDIQDARLRVLVGSCLVMVEKYDLNHLDIVSFVNRLENAIKNIFERAVNWLWCGDDRRWTPGMQSLFNKSFAEAQDILSDFKEPDDATAEHNKTESGS